ncbi:MAG: hypothetical protein OEZ06_17800 [Myxococcales bacterium]|nr:hypothetical protein [Myxococcales bacterium]
MFQRNLTRLLLACCVLVGAPRCTNDFDAFEFGDGDSDATALGDGSSGGAGADGKLDGGGGATQTADASGGGGGSGGSTVDAASDGSAVDGMDASADSSTTTTTDAGLDAGKDTGTTPGDDSGVDQVCATVLDPIVPVGRGNCTSCGCQSCDVVIGACLDSGDSVKDALCSDVVACALTNRCHDWDCYCTDMACNNPSGPCVAEMEAAAGGKKTEVVAIRTAGLSTEPLVRAMNVIDCTIGLHARSPGGATTGMCTSECL